MPISALVREQLSPSPTDFFEFRVTFVRCDLTPLLLKATLSYLRKKNTTFIWFRALTMEIHWLPKTGEGMSNELAEMEDEDIQRDTKGSTTRSGRKSRRPRESLFFFYYYVEAKETLDSSIHYSLLERIQVHDVSTWSRCIYLACVQVKWL